MSIALDQVTKRYQGVPVVNDVSLNVRQGEFLVLLGPSGCGKSTLLRSIAGLTEIDHGRISLHGRDVTHVNARDREVGFVFQHYALFRHMTIGENIEFALRVRRVKGMERRARVQELLKLVALDGMGDRLPAQLSGGQQQRIAVARALAHRPEVLLMDEPFGALDVKIREELRRTIREIQRELQITTILVTHDQEEAFALADRIGVMHQGRLLECGRPDELYTRPATRFVATFLGAANLLLGYKTSRGVRFSVDSAGEAPREVVAILRPEEVEMSAGEQDIKANFIGHGRVEDMLFAGAVERLRVRMAGDGPVPVAPGREGPNEALGSLLEVSRTLPEQRTFPVTIGQRVAVGARRIHVLPTPISSFTAVAESADGAQQLLDSPLLATLGNRMQTRVAQQVGRGERAPPGMPVVATGPGSAEAALWQLRHGAVQLLCVPPAAPAPNHVVIHTLDPRSRRATLAVAASLLRHVPAEAIYLGIHPVMSLESERAAQLRDLLDARSAALAEHGLDMRTELRPGAVAVELQRELAAYDQSMLVLGTSNLDALQWDWLASVLEGTPSRTVLFVNAARVEPLVEA
jgi:sulfate transport system ATP-binding protein